MCEGLGLGTNAMAALVTRGCAEMRRLSQTFGVRATPHSDFFLASLQPTRALRQGEGSTVFGLSGVGDTFGTCFGPLSRNRMVGLRLG